MKELQDIIFAYDRAVSQKKRTALVTVVQVEGSSYRRPGARMLVTEDGDITGAISGGCLEGDALRKAQLAMRLQQNKMEIYDTTDEEDHKLGVQLGCNGIVYILFEPIDDDDPDNPVNLLKKVASERQNALLVTIFNRQKNAEQTGTCGFINETGDLFSDDPDIQSEALNMLHQKQSAVQSYKSQSVLYQFVPPAIQLVIVGAGNDTQPLMDMAFLLGWNITVVDGRPAYATPQRFPKADRVLVVKPAEIVPVIEVDERTAVLLMTHNYNYDIAALEQFLPTACPYIGVLGPRKKLHKMLEELSEKGIRTDDVATGKIYGPVGLDIGAETAEEIALSVMAEIKAVFSDRKGAFLRDKQEGIHDRPSVLQHA
jgi:xanthine/CO dehydrogenase XdhC/CoxF family maturation factor